MWGWIRQPDTHASLLNLIQRQPLARSLGADTLHMLQGALTVSHMQARDCMVPEAQMITLSIDESPEVFLPRICESRHSRFPVYNRERTQIVGLVLAKDILGQLCQPHANQPLLLESIIRPCLFIPESKRLDQLLKELRTQHQHLAIVLDEYHGVAGLITIEDVIEEIVGDIEDEHYDAQKDDDDIKPVHEDEWIVSGLTRIDELNERLELTLNSDQHTLGGMACQVFGYVPQAGEKHQLQGVSLEILSSDQRRVHSLLLTRVHETSS